jgi:hypothetical protein
MDLPDSLFNREDETEHVREIAGLYNGTALVHAPFWLRVGALYVGGALLGQRCPGSTTASKRWLSELTKNFDENKAMASTLSVCALKNGELHVLEGQHRTLAARAAKGDNYLLRYTVYFGFSDVTDQRCAELIETIHDDRLPHTRDEETERDKALGKPDAVHLREIESRCGVTISSTGHIHAVVECRKIIRQRGAAALEGAIRVGIAAFGKDGHHLTSALLDGVSLFLSRHRDADTERLIRVMQKVGSSALHVLAAEYGGKGTGMCRALVRVYNRGLRTNRLPEE